jgi:hypothetical protein
MAELGSALAYSKESGRMLVIPVILDDAPIPAPARQYQALFVRDSSPQEVADQIAAAVASFVGHRVAVEDKKQETRARIEQNAAAYVVEAVEAQERAESRYRILGLLFYLLGLIALIAGLVFVFFALAGQFQSGGEDWIAFSHAALRSIIVIALLGACSKYAFSLGRSFTVESLKSADRLHAIAFGRFYLQVYGQDAEWSEVKEAFANWNISRPSAFDASTASEFDPKLLESIQNLVKSVRSEGGTAKE